MVLRGSEIKPEGNLPEQLSKLDSKRRELSDIGSELDRERNRAVELLKEAKIDDGKPASLGARKVSRFDEKKLEVVGEALDKVDKLETQKRQTWRDVDLYSTEFRKTAKQLLCGGAAGAIARTTVAPMDRIKILMQVAHVQKTTHLYGTMGQTVRHILTTEGPTGLWRGNFTNCVRVVPHSATQFVAYDKVKVYMIGSSDGKLSVGQRLLAGSLSGVAAATVTQPLDVVRIRLQTDPEVKGKIANAVRAMWNERGLITFYKGYTPAMLSLSPFIAVNFATFDTLKTWWYGSGKATKQELKDRNPFVVLGLGALAGIFAQTICYPLDTVRRRMQLKGKVYPNTPMAFVTIAREEGPMGFYRGMLPNAIKVMPNNAIRFAVYETLKNWFVEE